MMLSIFQCTWVAICSSSLVRYLFKYFDNLKNFVDYLIEFSEFFIYPGFEYFIQLKNCKSFLLVCACLLTSLQCFWTSNIFNFDNVQLINDFSLTYWNFCVLAKKSLPKPKSQRFSPMFFPRSLILLGFIFWSMIHFELIFIYGVW